MMISHKLETGDSVGVNHNGHGKILVQLTSERDEEQVRCVFTPEEAKELVDRIETNLLVINDPSAPSWPSLKHRVIKAEAKLKYIKELGLIVDVARSSDCPEGRLAHTTVEGSEMARLYDGIGDLIEAERKIEALKHDKTTAFAVERDMYMREAEKWKAIYLKAVEGDARDNRWEQAAAAFEMQHRIIVGILTDSQLDTRGPCGKFLREYKTAYQLLTESGVINGESQEEGKDTGQPDAS